MDESSWIHFIEIPEARPNKFGLRIKAILTTEKLIISLGLLT